MHVLRGCSSCPRLAGWLLFVDGLDRPAPLVRLQRAMDMPTPHKARYLAANEPRRNSLTDGWTTSGPIGGLRDGKQLPDARSFPVHVPFSACGCDPQAREFVSDAMVGWLATSDHEIVRVHGRAGVSSSSRSSTKRWAESEGHVSALARNTSLTYAQEQRGGS